MKSGIGTLTKRQAEVLRLDLFGFSQDEISRELNISQPRVSALLRRAKRKIKEAMVTVEFYEELKYLQGLRESGFKGDAVLKKGYHY